MRDAFGGAFMIKLFLVFIFVYMFFTAIALNYAKAFKVKNKVIDYLEDNEVIDLKGMYASETERMASYFEKEALGSLNYRIPTSSMSCKNTDGRLVYCQNGIKIWQYTANKSQRNKLGTYYKVETYFTWNLSFLKKLTELSSDRPNGEVSGGMWVISGETRAIVRE